jgi:hypothetical protein
MSHPGLGISMPITTAGSQEMQLQCNVREPGAQVGIMARMPGLHRVQSLRLKSLDHGPGAAFLQVSHRDNTSGSMHHLGHRPERGKGLLHECGTPSSNETIEGIARIGRSAMADDRSRNMRSPNRATAWLLQHALKRQVYPQPLELLNHLLGSAHSISPAAFQKGLQVWRVSR